ncbi:MAG: hypothetical protein M0P74_01905 [Syntrophales bacterium]|jgi:hypothetical protein|nr:hypothetical protein [Syntrophales bacterium]
MERIIGIASEYHLIAIAIGFLILLVVYFFLKSLMKIALFVLIIVIAIGSYFYFQHPGTDQVSVKDAFNRAKTDSEKVVEKGQDAWGKGKKLVGEGRKAYEKGKKTIENGKELLDKGVEKGDDFVEKVKKIVRKIYLLFETKTDDGAQQKK